MKYKVIVANTNINLEGQVNEAIRYGWKLYGNIVVVITQNNFTKYVQALTKEAR